MDGNKDAALKCFQIGKQALQAGNRIRALKFVAKAHRLNPSLAGVDDLLLEIQHESGVRSDSATGGVTDEVLSSSSSKPPGQSSVRHSVSDDGSSSASVAYTEEQVLIVRQIRKKKDYYEILGVEKTCTAEDVLKAYSKLSLKVHPDKNKAPGSEVAFKAVSRAFQCLSNEEIRKKYDVELDETVYERHPRHDSQTFYHGDVDADEIFRNFFGGTAPSTQFQGFSFGTGMEPDVGGVRHFGEFNLRMLIYLLPLLIILLVRFMPSSDPIFALYKSYPYKYKLSTQKGVPYYVKSSKFEQDYPFNSPNRVLLEKRIEGDYFSVLRQNCRHEMQHRQWGFTLELTHCEMLKRFENVA